MRYVERIIVVADGLMPFFVHDCCVPRVLFFSLCASFAFVRVWFVDKPSLQALRAETMVERFTARMHVALVWRVVFTLFTCDRSTSPSGGNQVDGLPPALSLQIRLRYP